MGEQPAFFKAAEKNENVNAVAADTRNSLQNKPLVTDWMTLQGLHYKKGTRTPEVAALNDKIVEIPGFMVPFEDNQNQVTEFLLVPSPQACIHVPPPPPNQMIYVKMVGDKKIKISFLPIWVTGKFHIQNNDSPYGTVSFYMEGDSVRGFVPKP